MRLAVWLFCCIFAFGQSTSPSSETKAPAPANASDRTDCPSTSGIAVCINAPASLEVPAGGSKIITASVGGTKEQAVDWIVECSSSACGKMTDDVYTAPIVRPNPPIVTLSAVSKADPTAKASIIIHLVRPASASSSVSTPETKSSAPAYSSDQKLRLPPPRINSFSKYAGSTSAGSAIEQAMQGAAVNRTGDSGGGVDILSDTRGGVDILSDTQGVDFGPYLQDIIRRVRQSWYALIPPSAQTKKGKLAIAFAVKKDGTLEDMRLVAASGDTELERPAWMSIAGLNPFPPLPNAFTGPYLALRFRFFYNPDKSDLDGSNRNTLPESAPTNRTAPTPSKSGITVSISSSGDVYIPAGGSRAVTATVTGTKDQTVEWSITGSGCSASACGKMTGDLYIAPSVQPSPPVVSLTATSKADPTAKATVNVHIVDPSSNLASKP